MIFRFVVFLKTAKCTLQSLCLIKRQLRNNFIKYKNVWFLLSEKVNFAVINDHISEKVHWMGPCRRIILNFPLLHTPCLYTKNKRDFGQYHLNTPRIFCSKYHHKT